MSSVLLWKCLLPFTITPSATTSSVPRPLNCVAFIVLLAGAGETGIIQSVDISAAVNVALDGGSSTTLESSSGSDTTVARVTSSSGDTLTPITSSSESPPLSEKDLLIERILQAPSPAPQGRLLHRRKACSLASLRKARRCTTSRSSRRRSPSTSRWKSHVNTHDT